MRLEGVIDEKIIVFELEPNGTILNPPKGFRWTRHKHYNDVIAYYYDVQFNLVM